MVQRLIYGRFCLFVLFELPWGHAFCGLFKMSPFSAEEKSIFAAIPSRSVDMIRTLMRALLCCVISICLLPLQAQQQGSTTLVSRAQIHITPENASLVPQMGLDLTHGTYIPGKYVITDLASWQVEQIRALGFDVDILIEDVTQYYQTRTAERRGIVCEDHQYDYRLPQNFIQPLAGAPLLLSAGWRPNDTSRSIT